MINIYNSTFDWIISLKIRTHFLNTNWNVSTSMMTSLRNIQTGLFLHVVQLVPEYHHHHHLEPQARISLTLYRHFSYHSSPLAGLQGYIPYPHIAAGCMFELVVLLLPGDMWGSIGVYRLLARPCFSSSDLHVWFV